MASLSRTGSFGSQTSSQTPARRAASSEVVDLVSDDDDDDPTTLSPIIPIATNRTAKRARVEGASTGTTNNTINSSNRSTSTNSSSTGMEASNTASRQGSNTGQPDRAYQPVILVNNEISMEMIPHTASAAATPTTDPVISITSAQPPVVPNTLSAPVQKPINSIPSSSALDRPVKFEPVGFGEADVGDEVVEVVNPDLDGTFNDSSFTSQRSGTLATTPRTTSSVSLNDNSFTVEDEDEDIVCVQNNANAANASQMPHQREACQVFPFKRNASAESGANTQYCPNCYCYVCDVPAANCGDWDSNHCNAWTKSSTSKVERSVRRNAIFKLLSPSVFCALFKQQSKVLQQITEEASAASASAGTSSASSAWSFLTPVASKITAIQKILAEADNRVKKFRESTVLIKNHAGASNRLAALKAHLNTTIAPVAVSLIVGALKVISARGLLANSQQQLHGKASVDEFCRNSIASLVGICIYQHTEPAVCDVALETWKTLPSADRDKSHLAPVENLLSVVIAVKRLAGAYCAFRLVVVPTEKSYRVAVEMSPDASPADKQVVVQHLSKLNSSERSLLGPAINGLEEAALSAEPNSAKQPLPSALPAKAGISREKSLDSASNTVTTTSAAASSSSINTNLGKRRVHDAFDNAAAAVTGPPAFRQPVVSQPASESHFSYSQIEAAAQVVCRTTIRGLESTLSEIVTLVARMPPDRWVVANIKSYFDRRSSDQPSKYHQGWAENAIKYLLALAVAGLKVGIPSNFVFGVAKLAMEKLLISASYSSHGTPEALFGSTQKAANLTASFLLEAGASDDVSTRAGVPAFNADHLKELQCSLCDNAFATLRGMLFGLIWYECWCIYQDDYLPRWQTLIRDFSVDSLNAAILCIDELADKFVKTGTDSYQRQRDTSDKMLITLVKSVFGIDRSASTADAKFRVPLSCLKPLVLSNPNHFPECPLLSTVNLLHSLGEVVPDTVAGTTAFVTQLNELVPSCKSPWFEIGPICTLRMSIYHLKLLLADASLVGKWGAEYVSCVLQLLWTSFLGVIASHANYIEQYLSLFCDAVGQFGSVSSVYYDVCHSSEYPALARCSTSSGTLEQLKVFCWARPKFDSILSCSPETVRLIPMLNIIMLWALNVQFIGRGFSSDCYYGLLALLSKISKNLHEYAVSFQDENGADAVALSYCAGSVRILESRSSVTNITSRLCRFWFRVASRILYVVPAFNHPKRFSVLELLLLMPKLDVVNVDRFRVTSISQVNFISFLGSVKELLFADYRLANACLSIIKQIAAGPRAFALSQLLKTSSDLVFRLVSGEDADSQLELLKAVALQTFDFSLLQLVKDRLGKAMNQNDEAVVQWTDTLKVELSRKICTVVTVFRGWQRDCDRSFADQEVFVDKTAEQEKRSKHKRIFMERRGDSCVIPFAAATYPLSSDPNECKALLDSADLKELSCKYLTNLLLCGVIYPVDGVVISVPVGVEAGISLPAFRDCVFAKDSGFTMHLPTVVSMLNDVSSVEELERWMGCLLVPFCNMWLYHENLNSTLRKEKNEVLAEIKGKYAALREPNGDPYAVDVLSKLPNLLEIMFYCSFSDGGSSDQSVAISSSAETDSLKACLLRQRHICRQSSTSSTSSSVVFSEAQLARMTQCMSHQVLDVSSNGLSTKELLDVSLHGLGLDITAAMKILRPRLDHVDLKCVCHMLQLVPAPTFGAENLFADQNLLRQYLEWVATGMLNKFERFQEDFYQKVSQSHDLGSSLNCQFRGAFEHITRCIEKSGEGSSAQSECEGGVSALELCDIMRGVWEALYSVSAGKDKETFCWGDVISANYLCLMKNTRALRWVLSKGTFFLRYFISESNVEGVDLVPAAAASPVLSLANVHLVPRGRATRNQLYLYCLAKDYAKMFSILCELKSSPEELSAALEMLIELVNTEAILWVHGNSEASSAIKSKYFHSKSFLVESEFLPYVAFVSGLCFGLSGTETHVDRTDNADDRVSAFDGDNSVFTLIRNRNIGVSASPGTALNVMVRIRSKLRLLINTVHRACSEDPPVVAALNLCSCFCSRTLTAVLSCFDWPCEALVNGQMPFPWSKKSGSRYYYESSWGTSLTFGLALLGSMISVFEAEPTLFSSHFRMEVAVQLIRTFYFDERCLQDHVNPLAPTTLSSGSSSALADNCNPWHRFVQCRVEGLLGSELNLRPPFELLPIYVEGSDGSVDFFDPTAQMRTNVVTKQQHSETEVFGACAAVEYMVLLLQYLTELEVKDMCSFSEKNRQSECACRNIVVKLMKFAVGPIAGEFLHLLMHSKPGVGGNVVVQKLGELLTSSFCKLASAFDSYNCKITEMAEAEGKPGVATRLDYLSLVQVLLGISSPETVQDAPAWDAEILISFVKESHSRACCCLRRVVRELHAAVMELMVHILDSRPHYFGKFIDPSSAASCVPHASYRWANCAMTPEQETIKKLYSLHVRCILSLLLSLGAGLEVESLYPVPAQPTFSRIDTENTRELAQNYDKFVCGFCEANTMMLLKLLCPNTINIYQGSNAVTSTHNRVNTSSLVECVTVETLLDGAYLKSLSTAKLRKLAKLRPILALIFPVDEQNRTMMDIVALFQREHVASAEIPEQRDSRQDRVRPNDNIMDNWLANLYSRDPETAAALGRLPSYARNRLVYTWVTFLRTQEPVVIEHVGIAVDAVVHQLRTQRLFQHLVDLLEILLCWLEFVCVLASMYEDESVKFKQDLHRGLFMVKVARMMKEWKLKAKYAELAKKFSTPQE
jgi:hypothetical protein